MKKSNVSYPSVTNTPFTTQGCVSNNNSSCAIPSAVPSMSQTGSSRLSNAQVVERTTEQKIEDAVSRLANEKSYDKLLVFLKRLTKDLKNEPQAAQVIIHTLTCFNNSQLHEVESIQEGVKNIFKGYQGSKKAEIYNHLQHKWGITFSQNAPKSQINRIKREQAEAQEAERKKQETQKQPQLKKASNQKINQAPLSPPRYRVPSPDRTTQEVKAKAREALQKEKEKELKRNGKPQSTWDTPPSLNLEEQLFPIREQLEKRLSAATASALLEEANTLHLCDEKPDFLEEMEAAHSGSKIDRTKILKYMATIILPDARVEQNGTGHKNLHGYGIKAFTIPSNDGEYPKIIYINNAVERLKTHLESILKAYHIDQEKKKIEANQALNN